MNSEKAKRYLIDDKDLPIVLVHGTMGKSEDWSRVVEELSNSRSVIRPNYIERVAGTNSTNELAIKDLADEVVAAVRAQGKQRFDLVGGSLGAAVATCVAAEYPEMVRSLVLVSGFSLGSDPRMNLQFKLWLRLVSTDKVAFTRCAMSLSKVYAIPAGPGRTDDLPQSFPTHRRFVIESGQKNRPLILECFVNTA
jgi:pimeloyl-ACP methyl ester carboxylesterase